jgi:hypothetical protein
LHADYKAFLQLLTVIWLDSPGVAILSTPGAGGMTTLRALSSVTPILKVIKSASGGMVADRWKDSIGRES